MACIMIQGTAEYGSGFAPVLYLLGTNHQAAGLVQLTRELGRCGAFRAATSNYYHFKADSTALLRRQPLWQEDVSN